MLNTQSLISLNEALISQLSSGEIVGVKDYALLDLTVNKPYQTAFGEEIYKTDVEKIVALYTALLRNHVFHNANKRVAVASLILMLKINDLKVNLSNEDLKNLSLSYVNHELSDEQVLKVILDSIL